MPGRFLFIIFSFLLASPAWATNRFADSSLLTDCTSGNYSISGRNCKGSDGNAYNTIQEGVKILNAGDTLHVRAGTYNEQLTVSASGTAGNHIEIRGYGSETAIIDGTGIGSPGNNQNLITINGASYIKINHLKIQNWHGEGLAYYSGNGSRSHIEITDNEFFRGNWPSGTTAGHAIVVTTNNVYNALIEYVKISNNYFHDIITGARYEHEVVTVAYNVHYFEISNNTIANFRNIGICAASDEAYGTYSQVGYPQYGYIANNTLNFGTVSQSGENSGIYMNAVRDVVIENNYIHGGYCAGILVSHEPWSKLQQLRVIVRGNRVARQYNHIVIQGPSDNLNDFVRVIHNSIWTDRTDASNGFWLGPNATSNIIKNNIHQKPAGIPPYHTNQGPSTSGNYTFDHNLWYPGGANTWYYKGSYYTWAQWLALGHDINGLVADPEFVDPSNGDFSLQPSSPAIESGGFLTKTVGSGSNRTALVVADPYYFIDGWGYLPGDRIRVGENTATVTSVNYATSTLTVSPAISWSSGDSVSYSYNGSAPDMGAQEYGTQDVFLSRPANLRIASVTP
jgi:hypothetical protein